MWFNKDIKIFVTNNVDSAGTILTTGIAPSNTKELLIEKDTLDFGQSVSTQVFNRSNLLETTDFLNQVSGVDTDIGKLSFSTILNTGSTYPLDADLWNNLVNSGNIPSDKWVVAETYKQLMVVRSDYTLNKFGIIIIVGTVAYCLNCCLVSDLTVTLPLESFGTNSWSIDYKTCTKRTVDITLANNLYTISGDLTGTIKREQITQYNLAIGKLTKLTIMDSNDTANAYNLNALGISISFTNTLNYITNNLFEKQDTNSIFTGAYEYNISGSTTVYSRTSLSELTAEIIAQQHSVDSQKLYKIFLEVTDHTGTIIEITINSCNLVLTEKPTQTLTTQLNFFVVSSVDSQNCTIKFYN